MDQLLDKVTAHYEERGFPASAINRLCSEIQASDPSDQLIRVGELTFRNPIDINKLIDELHRVRSDKSLRVASGDFQAIFCFSFGYRLKSRPVSAKGEEVRLPGVNNRALAEIGARLKKKTDVPLYAQFEIADALDDYTDVSADFSAPPEDMGTDPAVKHFLTYAKSKGIHFTTVSVVAHQHHMERCLLLLKDNHGIIGLPAAETYTGYDPREKQPRVMSPEEFILNDFVSTAVHLATRR